MAERKPWELGIFGIEAARKRGKDLWWEKTGGVGDLREFQDGEIANAAVKKVVEWLKDNNQPSVELREEEGFRIEAAVRLDGFLVLPEKEWAELKQEVGL